MEHFFIITVCVLIVLNSAYEIDELRKEDGYPICICPRIYAPVCASNGKTYGNTCEFNCKKLRTTRNENLRIVAYGRCDEQENTILQKIIKRTDEKFKGTAFR